MRGSKYFSTLDLASAFHQIKMYEPDKEKTAFQTGFQKFQFKRMPFGLKGSSITWQVYLTNILSHLIIANVMAYMDDILTYSKTIDGHTQTLTHIFESLRENGLKLKIEKTKLFAKRVEYLGHVIDEHGIKPNGRNIEAVQNFPRPKNFPKENKNVWILSVFVDEWLAINHRRVSIETQVIISSNIQVLLQNVQHHSELAEYQHTVATNS